MRKKRDIIVFSHCRVSGDGYAGVRADAVASGKACALGNPSLSKCELFFPRCVRTHCGGRAHGSLGGNACQSVGREAYRFTVKKNGGRVTLEFDRHADMEKARFETAVIVREARTSLPRGELPPCCREAT